MAEPAEDHQLVAAVRRGDDRAFEALYERYQRRIAAYVLGMVKDHGRAEDVTQEVFVSALRRIRDTERPIAFKPWIYEIAKNACIDQFRRSRRAEEVSLQAEEGLAPGDYRRLVGPGPSPDAAVAAKQDLDNLRGAFGALSDTHHEILVLRELEGLSYREIGDRMGLSRPAVESTLFRARRRLTEEYDELVSGARCERIHRVIQAAVGGTLGARESRRLARHVSHCQPCRREALAAGLDASILTHVPLRRRAAEKIAALLPLPGSLRLDRGGPSWLAQTPALSDQLGGGAAKLATVAAIVVIGLGAAGSGIRDGSDRNDGAPDRGEPATAQRSAGAPVAALPAAAPAKRAADRERRRADGERSRDRGGRRTQSTGAGAGASTPSTPDSTAPAGGTAEPTAGSGATPTTRTPKLPRAATPTTGDVGDAVETVTEPVQETTAPVTNGVNRTVEGVNETVQGVTDGVNDTVHGVTDGVNRTVGGVGDGVGETVGGVTDTVDGVTGGATQPLSDTVNDTDGGLLP